VDQSTDFHLWTELAGFSLDFTVTFQIADMDKLRI